jgi:hypothetical protein
MAAPFPRLIAAHFASPGLCYAKPLSGLAKRRKQPERYAPLFLKLVLDIKMKKFIEKDWTLIKNKVIVKKS